MKKLFFMLSLVVFLFGVSGCEKSPVETKVGNGEVLGGEEKYPVEVQLTEYSLVGTSCRWIDIVHNDVTVINSNEELAEYIECTGDSYPEIDFSKSTLLLVAGGTSQGIQEIDRHLLRLSENEYQFDIEVLLNDATIAQPFVVVVIVANKLSNKDNIKLNLKIN